MNEIKEKGILLCNEISYYYYNNYYYKWQGYLHKRGKGVSEGIKDTNLAYRKRYANLIVI